MYLAQALTLMRNVEDRRGEAWTLHSIAEAYSGQDDQRQALPYLLDALALTRQVEDRWLEAGVLASTAVVYEHTADFAGALGALQEAVALDQERGRPELAQDETALEALQSRMRDDAAPRCSEEDRQQDGNDANV